MTNYELINDEIKPKYQFPNWLLAIGHYFIILVSLFLIMHTTGCSRTVTPIVSYGEELVVSVTLRGNIDLNSNRYFMVISNNANYKIPLPPPDQLDDAPEFIEPDMTPQVGSLEAYFTNFFSTWSGYIILNTTGYELVKGPFIQGQAPTREVLATLGNINNKISFSFTLDRLFATIPDQVYFDVVTVPWPTGEEKVPSDHLPSTDNSISKIAGSIEDIDDDQDSGLDASLDIVNCRVEVQ
ncbi:MAG: hypothetical protein ABIH22_01715 [Candidatus Margulisiibacteriota bacterium]